MVDIGGYYYIRNPGWQILFAYGHYCLRAN